MPDFRIASGSVDRHSSGQVARRQSTSFLAAAGRVSLCWHLPRYTCKIKLRCLG